MKKLTNEKITQVLNDGLIPNKYENKEQKVGFFDVDNEIYLIAKIDLPQYLFDTINEYNNGKVELKVQQSQIEQLKRQESALQDNIKNLENDLSSKIEITQLDKIIVELEQMRKVIDNGTQQ